MVLTFKTNYQERSWSLYNKEEHSSTSIIQYAEFELASNCSMKNKTCMFAKAGETLHLLLTVLNFCKLDIIARERQRSCTRGDSADENGLPNHNMDDHMEETCTSSHPELCPEPALDPGTQSEKRIPQLRETTIGSITLPHGMVPSW
jgi:hypothetical protein